MGIDATIRGNQVVIQINEQFDRFSTRAFTEAYRGRQKGVAYVIDFKNVKAIDSTALGLLIKLREYAGDEDADISLININDNVMKMLRIANFQTLFKIR
ncbi:MAG: STAS domain-containing protein [Magnetococcales bacterium]|nr:STAS domain-containing protein [Magnetococcales bacterium]MBF0438899.1 STAS domain-containing protein [Magnetococcales bacterium]